MSCRCRAALLRWLAASSLAVLLTNAWAPQSAWATAWSNADNTTVGSDQYWYNPVNWTGNALPAAGTAVSADFNNGYNNAGNGVVFDPVGDPNFNVGADPAKADNPFIIGLMNVQNVGTASSKLTIKSGELRTDNGAPGATGILVGRGSNLTGTIVQTGGFFNGMNGFDLGLVASSVAGKGVYIYKGGTMEIGGATAGNRAIRLAVNGGPNTANPAVGQFIVYNATEVPGNVGHIRSLSTSPMSFNSNQSNTIGAIEFHLGTRTYTDGFGTHTYKGTMPLQIVASGGLTLQNPATNNRSSRLRLVLDEAPDVDINGVPQNLGLFDNQFGPTASDTGGGIAGSGTNVFANATIKPDGTVITDATDPTLTVSPNTLTLLTDGSTFSAIFGDIQYNWTIRYRAHINWFDTATGMVSSITYDGTNTQNDIVLLGLSSQMVPEPGSFVLLGLGALGLVGMKSRRRKVS